MRLIDHFDEGVARHPDRVFVADDARTFTYAQAQTMSRRIANRLRGAGLEKGAHVAVLSQNSVETLLMALGVLRAGCVWATFDISAKAEAAARALETLDVEALFYSAEYREVAEEIRAALPGLRVCACLDGEDGADLEGWLDGAEADFPDVEYGMEDLTTLFSSGGTTGIPKGVMATHRSWEVGLQATKRHTPHEHPIEALLMPVTHVGGGALLLCGMARGVSFIVLPRFDPELVMRTIQERRITQIALPPTALDIFLSHPRLGDYDFSSLRGVLYGSGPTPPALVKKAYEALGPVLNTGFGQTEFTTAATALTQEDHRRIFEEGDWGRLESCGRALPEFEVELMDEEGRILPPGETGEVVIRSGCAMTGYYKAPEETEAAFRFGWGHTGDIGRKDAEGFLYILDRQKDMIISRGYKIFPAEIERVLLRHPAVRECAVVGAPDAVLGEAPRAVVALEPGARAEPAELLAWCRADLGPRKTPAKVEIWDELPKSRIGKLLRREIRDGFWAGRDKRI